MIAAYSRQGANVIVPWCLLGQLHSKIDYSGHFQKRMRTLTWRVPQQEENASCDITLVLYDLAHIQYVCYAGQYLTNEIRLARETMPYLTQH